MGYAAFNIVRLAQIRDFVAVVDAGSISAAARLLGVSQPGLTKSIRSLETELAVSLLQRTPRGVLMTRYGRAFYARARAAHSELDKAHQELVQMSGVHSGKVAIGFGPMAAALVVPRAVQQFRERYPAVELRLLEGFVHALMPLVRDETLDMMIGPRFPGNRIDPALRYRPIFHNDQIIVVRRGHPQARPRSIVDLADACWLSFEPRAVIDRVLVALGLPGARQLIQCESLNVMVALLADTDMLAVTSRRLLSMPQAGVALQEISTTVRMPPMTTGLFVRADAPLTPAAAAMAKALVEIGRALPAGEATTARRR